MKRFAILSVVFMLLFAAGCKSSKTPKPKIVSLNGTWKPVKQVLGDAELPEAAFATQKMILKDSSYTVYAESIDIGIVRYDGIKMDIYGKGGVNNGKHFTAVYRYDKRQKELTVCYNLRGDSYPPDFDTKNKPMYFLVIYNKSTD